MKNKTISTWLSVSLVMTFLTTMLEVDDTVIGIFAILYLVFTVIAIIRLNKVKEIKSK